jgi:hypothetical protein
MPMTARVVIPSMVLAAILMAGCGQDRAPETQAQPEYQPAASVRELMTGMLEPSADAIWESVKITFTPSGVEERAPKTDEEWEALRAHALQLMEAGNLLQMPGRPMARTGEKSAFPGIELGPEEIQQLVDKDRAGWMMRARALTESLKPTIAAIDAKNVEMLGAAGEDIDAACENCHSQYWYPNAPEPPDTVPSRP